MRFNILFILLNLNFTAVAGAVSPSPFCGVKVPEKKKLPASFFGFW
jgi:hypothetical protein